MNQHIKQFEPLFALNTGGGTPASSDVYQALRGAKGAQLTYYMYFFNLVTNMFEWENLPPSMDATYIEDMLCMQGKCAFVYDNNNGLMCPQYTPKRIDWYGRPTQIECYANEYTATFEQDNFVVVRNTNNYVPTFQYIDYFVNRIIQVQEIADININAQKTPVVFKGTREQRVLLAEEFQKYDGNAWYLFLEKDALGGIDSVNTNAPYIANKLNEEIKRYTDMFLTFIGLNNANGTYKRERSLVDEIEANNELIGLTCESMLKARQKACDEFNEKFKEYLDKPISVRYSDQVQQMQEPNYIIDVGGVKE